MEKKSTYDDINDCFRILFWINKDHDIIVNYDRLQWLTVLYDQAIELEEFDKKELEHNISTSKILEEYLIPDVVPLVIGYTMIIGKVSDCDVLSDFLHLHQHCAIRVILFEL